MDICNEFIEAPDELKDGGDEVEYAPRSLAIKAKFESRTECANQVSEFHATPIDGKVELYDLVKKLSGDKVQHAELRKRLRRVEKKDKVLDVPLNKHEREQITRVVQYEKTTKDVTLWEPIIRRNRKADQLKFPLDAVDMQMHQTMPQFVQQHQQPRSQLEQQIAAVLHQSQPIVEAITKPLSRTEEAALRAMNLEEARLKRAELQKDRARAAFVAAKLRLQGKIKSKKYHRVQRKARSKQEQKKLEQMSADDPEAYQEFIQLGERQRIQERMSLRHKGTSRFMQKQTRYGKFNMASRQAVQDMLQTSQNLRQKSTAPTELDLESDSDSDDGLQLITETTERKTTLEDLENMDDSEDEFPTDLHGKEMEETEAKKPRLEVRIDPGQFLVVETEKSGKDGGSGVAGSRREGLALAFAGDEDVIAEFAAEKKAAVERERPKNIDLRLPGWGEWSGPGITMSSRRKKRFVIKAPPGPPRRDWNLGNVIISESKDATLAKLQVNSLPHPFTNVHEFERRISQPVGRQFNTVATFKKLTKPKIVTRLGLIITPMDKSQTFKKEGLDKRGPWKQDTGKHNTYKKKGAKSSTRKKNVDKKLAK